MSQAPYGTVEVRVPILQRTTSVMDEYGQGAAGKSQFDSEMRKMEEEMGKLTGQINEGNKRIASRIIQTTKTTTTRSSSGSFGNDSQLNAIQQQPQQQGSNVQQSFSTNTQSFSNTGNNQQLESFPLAQDTTQGANVVESRRTVTTHKTVTHSSSGGNLIAGQPQPQQQPPAVQWSSPGGSNVSESHSHHTTSQSQQHNTQQNQQQQQNQQIQWGSPAGSQVQESRSHHSTTSHSTTGQQQQQQFQQQNNQTQVDQQNNQELQQWLGNLQSPLISNHQDIAGQDGKCLKLRFDVSQYRADEISVKMVDGKLKIHAKHEEKSDNKSAYREFSKEFSLPIGTNPESIKSTLSKDGILTVEAPFPNQLTSQSFLPLTNY